MYRFQYIDWTKSDFVNIFMQEVLNNCGKSAIANARGQLAELSA
jgi:hypothetical protein